MKMNEFRFWLKGQHEDTQKLTGEKQVKTAVIIRADGGADRGPRHPERGHRDPNRPVRRRR